LRGTRRSALKSATPDGMGPGPAPRAREPRPTSGPCAPAPAAIPIAPLHASSISWRSGGWRCWFEKRLRGRRESQRRGLERVEVSALGGRTPTKPLVCARERASQFPLRPYSWVAVSRRFHARVAGHSFRTGSGLRKIHTSRLQTVKGRSVSAHIDRLRPCEGLQFACPDRARSHRGDQRRSACVLASHLRRRNRRGT
jgi:hypothetical protein